MSHVLGGGLAHDGAVVVGGGVLAHGLVVDGDGGQRVGQGSRVLGGGCGAHDEGAVGECSVVGDVSVIAEVETEEEEVGGCGELGALLSDGLGGGVGVVLDGVLVVESSAGASDSEHGVEDSEDELEALHLASGGADSEAGHDGEDE